VIDLSKIVLTRGSHRSRQEGMFAGEEHSDVPSCVCPVVTCYVQGIKDARWSSNEARTAALVPWLACGSAEAPHPCILGSRSTREVEQARARWLAHRALTWWAPLAGMIAVRLLEANGYDYAYPVTTQDCARGVGQFTYQTDGSVPQRGGSARW
jgi:hypothetical protein